MRMVRFYNIYGREQSSVAQLICDAEVEEKLLKTMEKVKIGKLDKEYNPLFLTIFHPAKGAEKEALNGAHEIPVRAQWERETDVVKFDATRAHFSDLANSAKKDIKAGYPHGSKERSIIIEQVREGADNTIELSRSAQRDRGGAEGMEKLFGKRNRMDMSVEKENTSDIKSATRMDTTIGEQPAVSPTPTPHQIWESSTRMSTV